MAASPITDTIEIGWEKAVAGTFRLDFSTLDSSDVMTTSFNEFFGASFTDVSADTDSVRIARGRSEGRGPMRAGEATITLADIEDPDKYNPNSTSSPLASLEPGFKPMRPIRIKRTLLGVDYTRFYGFIRRADFDPETQMCTIYAQDLFLWLERARPIILAGALTTGGGIGKVFDAIDWTEPALRRLDVGDTLGASFSADGSESGLALIESLLVPELGVVFIARDGVAVYEDRYARAQRTSSVATFTDVLIESSSAIDLDSIINRYAALKTGGVKKEAEDVVSIHDFGVNEAPLVESPYFQNDDQAEAFVKHAVAQLANPQPPVVAALDRGDDAQLATLLALDLQDRITLDTTDLHASGDFHVEHILEEWQGNAADHRVRFTLSKRPPELFVLGTSLLDGTHQLAY